MNRRSLLLFRIVLFPFSFFYWLIVGIRNLLFRLNILSVTEFDLPVISVGNITVGGTGKTPHIEYLAGLLMHKNYKPAVLSRGYKRKSRGFQIADSDSPVSQVGDEPKQLKKKYPGLLVATDRKRVHGINELLSLPQAPDLVLLDDAFQHRFVKPGLSIVLIDYNRLISDDYLLPAGRLREPASSLKRADIVIVTKSPEEITEASSLEIEKKLGIEGHQKLYFTSVVYQEIRPVFDTANTQSLAQIKQQATSVLLVTGIANPLLLRTFAREFSSELKELKFPDHYTYSLADMVKIRKVLASMPGENPVMITTEKDAMRLMELEPGEDLKKIMYYIPIKVTFVGNQKEAFDPLILDYVKSNKRDTDLHKKSD